MLALLKGAVAVFLLLGLPVLIAYIFAYWPRLAAT